jgi:ADP-ribosylglycohydrolase
MEKTHYIGAILGLAVGDALGAVNEFRPWPAILQDPVREMRSWGTYAPGTWTDDTEMAIEVSNGLINAPDAANFPCVLDSIAACFSTWFRSHDPGRAPGSTCLAGTSKIHRALLNGGRRKKGVWKKSGIKSNGCGAVMRVAPVGLAYPNSEVLRTTVAEWQARMTHNHIEASDSSVIMAHIVANATKGPLVDIIMDAAASVSEGRTSALVEQAIAAALDHQDPQHVLNEWRGWDSATALAGSIFCALTYPGEYKQAVLAAVNSPGDSDSLGAITGAIIGARLGESAIPQEWREVLERHDDLVKLAESLWESKL